MMVYYTNIRIEETPVILMLFTCSKKGSQNREDSEQ